MRKGKGSPTGEEEGRNVELALGATAAPAANARDYALTPGGSNTYEWSTGMACAPGRPAHVTNAWVDTNWELVCCLGAGRFVSVTRQKSRPSGEKYALKKVNGQSFFEFVAERKSNLTQNSEAELLAIAQHPCIARLVASFYTSTRMLLLTEELGTSSRRVPS